MELATQVGMEMVVQQGTVEESTITMDPSLSSIQIGIIPITISCVGKKFTDIQYVSAFTDIYYRHLRAELV